MIAALFFVAVIALMMCFVIIVFAQAILPCNKCPHRDQCKQLEENDYPNICTQQMLKSNYGEKL